MGLSVEQARVAIGVMSTHLISTQDVSYPVKPNEGFTVAG